MPARGSLDRPDSAAPVTTADESALRWHHARRRLTPGPTSSSTYSGCLVRAADRTGAGLGLTSTRWQVLGRASASAGGERPFRGPGDQEHRHDSPRRRGAAEEARAEWRTGFDLA